MIRILRFHWQLYATTTAAIGIAVAARPWLPSQYRQILTASMIPAIFWALASLVTSWYVYDRGPLPGYTWLARCLSRPPERWLNLHAGLDDVTAILPGIFPLAEGRTLDIFDAREMTEPSILQARRVVHAPSAASGAWKALPTDAASFDAAFLIFTAHELRRMESRVRLFSELARVLRPAGEIVLVEHLRDWRNFLAFGTAALHFFSARTWRSAAAAAGLRVRREFPIAGFVRVFVLERVCR
jgi:SAM-dependent methyltransferase